MLGQHIASPQRFDDELGWGILHEEAAKYYANIVLPYGDQVKKALEAVSGLDVDMIAPSHGIIWRSRVPDIIAEYKKWCSHQTEERCLIVYDSMWGSTEKMAHALRAGVEDAGVPVTMRDLKTVHISDIMTDLLVSKAVLIGCPTLNNGMLPSMAAFLSQTPFEYSHALPQESIPMASTLGNLFAIWTVKGPFPHPISRTFPIPSQSII